MKTSYFISLVTILLLTACQQSGSPESGTESQPAPVAVEKEIQAEVTKAERPELETLEKSEPVSSVHKPLSKIDEVKEVPVVEEREVQATVIEEIATDEVVKQPIPAPVEVKKPEIKTVVVETAAGNAEKGAKLTKGKCGACHYFDKDRKKVGPTLMGIYNRAPAIDGVPYATWDSPALDAWLTNPKAVKPKTRMGFRGISDQSKRDDIIAYLKTL